MINFKKKNKNKIVTLILAIFLFAIPFLPLFKNSIGTTFAYSPTQPTIDSTYFDYTSTDFASKFDGYVDNFYYGTDFRFYLTLNENIPLPSSSVTPLRIYYLNNGKISNISYSSDVSYTSGYLSFSFLNIDQIVDFLQKLPFLHLLTFYSNSVYYTIMGEELHSSYVAYNKGLSSTDGYEEGYDAGHSDGYQEGYEEGYNSFVEKYTGFGVFNNASLNIFTYSNNKYTEVVKDSSNNPILDVYKTVSNNINYTELESGVNFGSSIRISTNLSWYNYMRLNVFDNNLDFTGKFVVTPNNLIDLRVFSQFSVDAGGVVVEGAQKVFNGTITFNLNNGQSVDFTNANLSSGLNLSDYSGNSVVSIEFKFNNFSAINDLSLSLSNVNFTLYYDKGFEDGKNSVDKNSIYTNGYNAGHSDGYESGKNYGITHANEYSFLGLIGAIVDAPIKAFTGLFDFEILGFNISSFILSLITVCVIITVVKLLLGGK